MSAPNQKTIVIRKEETTQQKGYWKIDKQAYENAVEKLNNLKKYGMPKENKAVFPLWIYLSTNAPNYELELSSKHFCEHYNVSKTTYENAVKILIEMGFLKKVKGLTYDFIEFPKEEIIAKESEKNSTGISSAEETIVTETIETNHNENIVTIESPRATIKRKRAPRKEKFVF